VTVLPMSDQRVETHVVVTDPDTGRQHAIHFQEWWVRHRAAPDAAAFVQVGVDTARPAPGVAEAFAAADAVLLAPSNPVVSIGTILGVPGMREALLATPGRVVGVSPIIGGEVVRGMADRCLPVLGIEVSAEGVGRHYGARSAGGLLDAWLVAPDDPTDVPGADVRQVPLLMSGPEETTALARAALDAAGV
jgi:LPPG:FO 2-phospho-L-lactate transferase